jgi:trehalose 6-phosphate phosphatase
VDPLAALRADPTRTAIFLDFDGTLAPIVAVAADARPVPGAVDALRAARDRFAVVAVVSGRPVAFLDEHLPPGLERHGLYGLESVVDGEPVVHGGATAWGSVVDEVVDAARRTGPTGLDVEHKGYSLTLHYRRHPDRAEAVRQWAEDAAARSGLLLRAAKMSLELHPPVPVDKGTVVASRAVGMTAVAYVGDDEGDLPAFAALDALALAGVATVKVAVHTADASPRLLARSDLQVEGPEGSVALLRALLLE